MFATFLYTPLFMFPMVLVVNFYSVRRGAVPEGMGAPFWSLHCSQIPIDNRRHFRGVTATIIIIPSVYSVLAAFPVPVRTRRPRID